MNVAISNELEQVSMTKFMAQSVRVRGVTKSVAARRKRHTLESIENA